MVVSGSISAKVQVNASASATWEIYGTFKLLQYAKQALPDVIDRIEVQGDGSVGTVLEIFFLPDTSRPFSSYKEKYVTVDNEKRVKEADIIEGGYLDLGFTLYRFRFAIIEKDEKSCMSKVTIEYNIKDEFGDNVSLVTTDLPVAIMNYIANYFTTTNC